MGSPEAPVQRDEFMVREKRTLEPRTKIPQNLKVLEDEFQEMTALPEVVKTPAGQA